MTIIKAELIADSVSPKGARLSTLILTYPRYIHSEFMTHRVFSRNSASSRAIPSKKQLAAIREHPVIPITWGVNKAGMQSMHELIGWRKAYCKFLWNLHRRLSLWTVTLLSEAGLHKQWANRLIEPHSHIRVIVTATDWANFFALRMHPDAMPEFIELATAIYQELSGSNPKALKPKEWHLPLVSNKDREDLAKLIPDQTTDDYNKNLIMISVARCARTSYTIFDNNVKDLLDEIELAKRLISQDPLHASPMEHQGTPDPAERYTHQWGNFRGWIQYRKTYASEAKKDKPYDIAPVSMAIDENTSISFARH